MNLHEDTDAFISLVSAVCTRFSTAFAVVEKDYYVTHLLKEIVLACPETVFIGGTSLSKCYRCIDRFSEDIDLSYDNGKSRPTEGLIRRFNKGVLQCCQNNSFGELIAPPTQEKPFSAGGRYHSFKIAYRSHFESPSIENNVRVEISLFSPVFPVQWATASSYITDYLRQEGKEDLIEEFGLAPFSIKTQTLEKTFIDKVFVICDCHIRGEKYRNSRHIYDLYKIFPRISTDDNFKDLIGEIRKVRNARNKINDPKYRAPSAKPEENINTLLTEIIEEETFKEDYLETTRGLLLGDYSPSYEEVASVLNKVIELSVF